MNCNNCPRNCHKDRDKFLGTGFCNTGYFPKVARIAPHFDEEPIISGTNGSGAIFFSGCNLKCIYCQNYEISSQETGKYITTRELAAEIMVLEAQNVHNIDFITGSHYTDAILETLNNYKPKIPIIYNSSGYDDISALKKLNKNIDVYLPDFKYCNNDIAHKYSNCSNYIDYVIPAITEMLQQVGNCELDEKNIIKKGVIIRHLVLPNNTNNSIKVLEMINSLFGNEVKISLMSQYTPCYKAKSSSELNRPITKREYDKVVDKMIQLNFDGFIQELSSSNKEYIPIWDYK